MFQELLRRNLSILVAEPRSRLPDHRRRFDQKRRSVNLMLRVGHSHRLMTTRTTCPMKISSFSCFQSKIANEVSVRHWFTCETIWFCGHFLSGRLTANQMHLVSDDFLTPECAQVSTGLRGCSIVVILISSYYSQYSTGSTLLDVTI